MANYANLLATIAANIYTNGNNEVTAAMVKTAVDSMVASLGAGYQFMGVATPATNPSNPDAKQFYIAGEAGTYSNFGGAVLEDGEIGLLYGSGTSWSLSTIRVNDSTAQDILARVVDAIGGESVDVSAFTDGYVEHSSGAIVSNNGWRHSDFIRIDPQSNIVYQYLETDNSYVSAITFYDEDKTKLDDISNIGPRDVKRVFYNIPAGTMYVRYSILASDAALASVVVFPEKSGVNISENAERVYTLSGYYLDNVGRALANASFDTALYNVSNLRGKSLKIYAPTSSAYIASFAVFDSFQIVGNPPLVYGDTTNNGSTAYVDLSAYPKAVCCAVTFSSGGDDTTEVSAVVDDADVKVDVRNGHRDRFGECYKVASLAAGLTFNGLQNGIAGNKQLTFSASINSTFTGLRFGQGYNLYGGMTINLTPTKLYVYKNNDLVNAVAEETHGLTISTFVAINVRFDRDTRVHLRLIGDSGAYDMATELYLLASHGPVFLTAISTLDDVVISSTSMNLDSKVWFVGDSFISINDTSRWGYYLVNQYDANPMIIGYPGAGAQDVLPFVRSALAFGNPGFIVWCVGMNNPDSGAIDPTWKAATDEFIAICRERGIVPIFQLIPNSKGSAPGSSDLSNQHLHDYKNAYMLSLGYRTIDIPAVVGADSDGNWRAGWHFSDYIHPNALSASAIALAMIANVPECLNQ